MSLIIKGIDLPKEGEDITLEINHKGEVRVYSTELKETDTDAEAIQIPKGHGDIKDEAEIIKLLEEKEKEPKYQHDMDDWWVGIIDAETEVNKAPTILEAEE